LFGVLVNTVETSALRLRLPEVLAAARGYGLMSSTETCFDLDAFGIELTCELPLACPELTGVTGSTSKLLVSWFSVF